MKGVETVRFGLIGCGRVARFHADALTRLPGVSLVAVADVIKDRADAFSCQYGGDPYVDYREMLARNDLDVVCICTPSGDHPKIGIDAARARKHVVVEKPIALTLTEADDLIRVCREMGVKLCVCHQNRFNAPVRRMRQALEDGLFGRISHAAVAVRWNRNMSYYKEASWRGTWKQDGGVLMNQSIHGVDIFRWMMGAPEIVFGLGATQFHDIETEDVAVAAVRFESGALGTIEVTSNVYPSNWEETLVIFGEKGSAALGGVALNRIERWEFADQGVQVSEELFQAPDPKSVYGNGHAVLLEAMAEAVRVGGKVPVSGEDGRSALEMVLGVYRSWETGAGVQFPLTGESDRIKKARHLN